MVFIVVETIRGSLGLFDSPRPSGAGCHIVKNIKGLFILRCKND